MSRASWYCHRNGVKCGPYRRSEIREQVLSGEIRPYDLLWKKGLKRWKPAGDFPKLFRDAPPRRFGWQHGVALVVAAGLLLVALVLSPVSDFYAAMPPQLQGPSTAISCISGLLAVVVLLAVIGHLSARGRKIPVVVAGDSVPTSTNVSEDHRSLVDESGGQILIHHSAVVSQDQWFVQVSGKKLGPISRDLLRERLSEGLVSPADKVWRLGMAGWTPAADVDELGTSMVPSTAIVESGSASLRLPNSRFASHIALPAAVTVAVLVALFYLSPRWGLPRVPVSGSVAYDDGAVLPVDSLILRFHSLVRARDARTLPPHGTAVVDAKTGTFSSAKTTLFKGGLIEGLHKITLHSADGQALDPAIVPGDYSDATTTILRVHTKDSPFTIRIRRP